MRFNNQLLSYFPFICGVTKWGQHVTVNPSSFSGTNTEEVINLSTNIDLLILFQVYLTVTMHTDKKITETE